jgi:hypothetical protein
VRCIINTRISEVALVNTPTFGVNRYLRKAIENPDPFNFE